MNEINKFLNDLGLSLEDCNEDWVENVKNFQSIENTLTDEEKAKKRQQLLNTFYDYHEIVEEDQDNDEYEKEHDEIKIEYKTENATRRHEARKNLKFNISDLFN